MQDIREVPKDEVYLQLQASRYHRYQHLLSLKWPKEYEIVRDAVYQRDARELP
jgi:hypothetical protein